MMKRMITFIVTASLIMAFVFAGNGERVQAAVPKLSRKTISVTAGSKVRLKVTKTKKTVRWTVKKGKKYIRLKGKNKRSVTIQGIKKGTAQVQCKIGKRKLVCKVKVKGKKNTAEAPKTSMIPTLPPDNSGTPDPTLPPPDSSGEPGSTLPPQNSSGTSEPTVTPPETSNMPGGIPDSETTPVPEETKVPSGSVNEEEKNVMQMSVEANGKTILFELNDSQAARDLYGQLPLTIDVSDYSTNEKIFYPPGKLNTVDAPMANASNGTLAYYGPWGDVVMFYDDFGSAGGLYELGHVISGGEFIREMSGTIQVSRYQ